MRLSGCCDRAELSDEGIRIPIILDSKSLYTRLLMKHYHEKNLHQGQETIANELRKRFCILNFRSALKKVTNDCQRCKNNKLKLRKPLMGQLPMERLVDHVNPFTFVGMDFFGPLTVQIGRRHEKRYGVLFTCMTTRCIHLEIAASLNTDSAIMAIKRFIARRGFPEEILSDNGSNFIGAEKELKAALKEFDCEKIKKEMAIKGIKWKFIPPKSPHMGGCWERLIRSVKTGLKVVLKERSPKEEMLQTLFAEVEFIVNNRPLTHVSVDERDLEALTPNNFLIGKSADLRPNVIGNFSDEDFYHRKQWSRWIKEYLPTLTRRTNNYVKDEREI